MYLTLFVHQLELAWNFYIFYPWHRHFNRQLVLRIALFFIEHRKLHSIRHGVRRSKVERRVEVEISWLNIHCHDPQCESGIDFIFCFIWKCWWCVVNDIRSRESYKIIIKIGILLKYLDDLQPDLFLVWRVVLSSAWLL